MLKLLVTKIPIKSSPFLSFAWSSSIPPACSQELLSTSWILFYNAMVLSSLKIKHALTSNNVLLVFFQWLSQHLYHHRREQSILWSQELKKSNPTDVRYWRNHRSPVHQLYQWLSRKKIQHYFRFILSNFISSTSIIRIYFWHNSSFLYLTNYCWFWYQ